MRVIHKFSEVCPEGMKNSVAGAGKQLVKFMDKFCEKYIQNSSVLMIGTGFTKDQYYEWPDTLVKCGASSAEYLEVCEHYYEKWKEGKYRVTLGDVKDIRKIFPDNSFDVVLWTQGPEHISQHEMKQVFSDILHVAKRAVLFSCPYGSYYDKQGEVYRNVYEAHVQKDMTLDSFDGIEGYNIEVFGEKNKGDAAMYVWKEKLMVEKILVVGGAGYAGGRLVDCLRKFGHDVTVYDNLTYEQHYLKEISFIYGDVRDREKLLSILPAYDVVIWLAAIVGDGACAIDPFLTQSINEDSVKWLVDNYDKKIIFTSTCSVYGINNELIDESAGTNPISVYAKTKLEAEQYIVKNAKDYLIFRLGTLYGLGDEHSRIRLDLVVNVLSKKAALGEPLSVFGGEQWRPLLHVRDVASAIIYSLGENISGLYNLNSGNYTIKDIARTIQKIVPETQVEYKDVKFEDQRNYRVKCDAFLNKGWSPSYTLEDGITQMVETVRSGKIKNLDSVLYSNQQYLGKNYAPL